MVRPGPAKCRGYIASRLRARHPHHDLVARRQAGGDPLTARVNWGDGQLEAVVVKPDGSIQTAHTYAGSGAFPVTLILSDDERLTVSDSKNVLIYSPVETINRDLIPGTLNMVNQGILNQGQADSLVVKLQGTITALENDRPAAPQKLPFFP